ncbi:MAG: GAF domain-containing protein [Chloroflexaceae bacterium]|nr:GAF domain-containing protein [Chloroflexaceae bacterium]
MHKVVPSHRNGNNVKLASSPITIHDDTDETTELDRLRNSLARQKQRSALLIWLGNVVSRVHDQAQLAQRSIQLIAKAYPMNCWFIVRDQHTALHSGYSYVDEAEAGLDAVISHELYTHPAIASICKHGESAVINDVSRDLRWQQQPLLPMQGSALVLPLAHNGSALGVLIMHAYETRAFPIEDALLLQSIAAQLAVSLAHLQLQQSYHERREQLQALLLTSQYNATLHTLPDLAKMIHERSTQLFPIQRTLLFVEQGAGKLELAQAPTGRLYTHELFQQEISALAATVWQTSQSQQTHLAEPMDLPCLAVPLQYAGRNVGVLILLGDAPESLAFSAGTWALLTVFANLVAAACAQFALTPPAPLAIPAPAEPASPHLAADEPLRQLKAETMTLRTMLDALSDGVLLLDADEVVLEVNVSFSRTILGLHPREVVGRAYDAIWQELEQRGLHLTSHPDHSPNAPQGRQMYAVKCVDAQGEQGWYLVKRDPVLDAADEPVQYLEYWELMG